MIERLLRSISFLWDSRFARSSVTYRARLSALGWVDWLIHVWGLELMAWPRLDVLLQDWKSVSEIIGEQGWSSKYADHIEYFLDSMVQLGRLKTQKGRYRFDGEIRLLYPPTQKWLVSRPTNRPIWIPYPDFYLLENVGLGIELARGKSPGLQFADTFYSSDYYISLRRAALKHARAALGGIAVDLGCGTGWSTANLYQEAKPRQIYAVDHDQMCLNLAERSLKERNPELYAITTFVKADVSRELPIDKKVDIAFSSSLFQWLPPETIPKVFENVYEGSNKGAMFCGFQIMRNDPDKRWPDYRPLNSPFQWSAYKEYPTVQEMKQAALNAGFKYFQTLLKDRKETDMRYLFYARK